MKIKNLIALLLLTACCAAFSGCTLFNLADINELLRPPALTGENAAVQKAFERTAGSKVNLFSPVAGDYRSSYIYFDCDNNGKKEAIVFYSPDDDKNTVHMQFMVQNGAPGELLWSTAADISGSGSGVYKVDFFDIDSDGCKEIAVTWTQDSSEKNKPMSIYKINFDIPMNEIGIDEETKSDETVSTPTEATMETISIHPVATIPLAGYICIDMDLDARNEFLYFYFNSSLKLCARFLEFNGENETMQPVSDFEFSSIPDIEAIIGIYSDMYMGEYRVYLDLKTAGEPPSYCSEVLMFDRNKSLFVRPDINGASVAESAVRNIYIPCEDIDGNGIMDIPYCDFSINFTLLNEDGHMPADSEPISFFSFAGADAVTTERFFISETDGFKINIDSFFDYSSITYDCRSRKVSFYFNSGSETNDTEDELLFSVVCKRENALDEVSGGSYVITLGGKGKELNMSEKHIKNLISTFHKEVAD